MNNHALFSFCLLGCSTVYASFENKRKNPVAEYFYRGIMSFRGYIQMLNKEMTGSFSLMTQLFTDIMFLWQVYYFMKRFGEDFRVDLGFPLKGDSAPYIWD